MAEVTMMDVIVASYGLSETGVTMPYPPPTKATTALLLIDIQGLAAPDHLVEAAVQSGLPEDQVRAAVADYRQRFNDSLANCARVLRAAREHGVTPIHVKIQTLSADGRDTGMVNRMLGWNITPDKDDARFLPECAPEPGEIVLTKTVSGAFTGTTLDRVLRHMGIQYLYVCGFVTDECVETTIRDALDFGYLSSLVADATTTYFAEAHAFVIMKFSSFGLAPSTDQVCEVLAGLPEK